MRSPERSGYRIVAVSLRPEDIAAADRIVDALRDEGWPHANRSLVVREALAALGDSLRGRSAEGIFKHFIDRRGRRIPGPTKPSSAA